MEGLDGRDRWGFGLICVFEPIERQVVVGSTKDLPAGRNYKHEVTQDPVPVLLGAAVLPRVAEYEADDV